MKKIFLTGLFLLLGAVAISNVSCVRDSQAYVLETMLIEAGENAPSALFRSFQWMDMPDVEALFPREALISDDVQQSFMTFTDVGIIKFPDLTVSVGRTVQKDQQVPYIGCVSLKNLPTKTAQQGQTIPVKYKAKLKKISQSNTDLFVQFQYTNDLLYFDMNQWVKASYGLGPHKGDVVLPLGKWVFTMSLTGDEANGIVIYVGMKITAVDVSDED